LYRYLVSQYSEFCRHNPLCCFSTRVYCSCCWLLCYRLGPETFGYTLMCPENVSLLVSDHGQRDSIRNGHWHG